MNVANVYEPIVSTAPGTLPIVLHVKKVAKEYVAGAVPAASAPEPYVKLSSMPPELQAAIRNALSVMISTGR